MKSFLFDTSVIVAGSLSDHSHYTFANPWLNAAQVKNFTSYLSTHALAEIYATFTSYPRQPPLLPDFANAFLRKDILSVFLHVELGLNDYKLALERVSLRGAKSGAIYDALHIQAAIKKKCHAVVTFNEKHFAKLAGKDIAVINPLTRKP